MSSWDFRSFLSDPSPSCSVPQTFHQPNAEENVLVERLIAYFGKDGYDVPGSENGGLTDWEMMFLVRPTCVPYDEADQELQSREGIIRFLIATKWDDQLTIKRLEKCLAWRRKESIDDLQLIADKVEAEYAKTGGQLLLGYTKQSQPVIVMQVNKRDTPPSYTGLLQLFFLMERSMDLMPPGVTKTSFIVDFTGKRKYSTPISLAKEWVTVLQDCYPERLAVGAIVNIPWVINIFLQAVYVFLDPVTKSKIVLNPSLKPSPAGSGEGNAWPPSSLAEVIPPDQLLTQYGGEKELQWTDEMHKGYWSALVGVCAERRERYREKWRTMGGGVGRSEFEFKLV
ncbi:Phosphatidylinositol transfer protein (PITP) [Naganishia albida]|nr:Phosphatidylinositol transfer protein (PITP) [Naganishia albida]